MALDSHSARRTLAYPRRWRRGGNRTGACLGLVLALALGATPAAGDEAFDEAVLHDLSFAGTRVGATADALAPPAYPQLTRATGTWVTTDGASWTSGFLAGSLWLLHQATADAAVRAEAERWETELAAQRLDGANSDLGFMLQPSFGADARLSGSPAARQVVLDAAATLATRFDPAVGCIRSRDGGLVTESKVVVDTTMNLELLFWAAAHGGDPAWRAMATSHALKTIENHLRADGSVYQMVVYDRAAGTVLEKRNVQGYDDESTWARGQAWAVHGLTTAYRYTGDRRFLAGARRAADYLVTHVPPDSVPYWDFEDPAIPLAPRDTSAAAIAASGLVELGRLERDRARGEGYLAAARRILSALSAAPYLAEETAFESVLLEGTHQKRNGTAHRGLVYGDHYLLEALLRLRLLPEAGAPLPISAATASANAAAASATIDGDKTTRWTAKGDGQWLRYDLGSSRTVSKVSVTWVQGAGRAARFDVQLSDDAAAWTTALGSLSSGAVATAETYDLADRPARFVRLLLHGTSAGTANGVAEVAIR